MQGIGNFGRAVSALFLVLSFACETAGAQTTLAQTPGWNVSPQAWTLQFGNTARSAADFTRTMGPAPGGGGAGFVRDISKITTPGGAVIEVATERSIAAAAAKTAMKAVARATAVGAAAGVGVAVYDWWKDRGIDVKVGDVPRYDPGQQKIEQGGMMTDFRTGQPMSPAAILAREQAQVMASQCSPAPNNGYCTVEFADARCFGGNCSWTLRIAVRYNSGNVQYYSGGSDERGEITAQVCPQTSLAPLRIVLGDAPCPSNDRAMAGDAELDRAIDTPPAALEPAPTKDTTLWDILTAIDGAGNKIVGAIKAGQAKNQGPASVTDPNPQRVTGPDGKVTETAKRYDLTYHDDRVSYTTTVTNTTVNNDNTTTTTTTENPQDQKTDCEVNPQAIGCAKFGAPDDQDVPKTTVPISVTPVELAQAACPANVQFQAFGTSHEFNMTPVCGAVNDYVKPLMLVAGALAAAVIFAGGLKT